MGWRLSTRPAVIWPAGISGRKDAGAGGVISIYPAGGRLSKGPGREEDPCDRSHQGHGSGALHYQPFPPARWDMPLPGCGVPRCPGHPGKRSPWTWRRLFADVVAVESDRCLRRSLHAAENRILSRQLQWLITGRRPRWELRK